jgi:tetratricopeptide (TPR) repeat protein
MSTFGLALGFGGYPSESLDPLERAMRASPHDPLTWHWLYLIGLFQILARDFETALAMMRQVIRLRPGHASAHHFVAACLAHLGRLGEAHEALEHARAEFPGYLQRFRQAPWQRPEDHALWIEGLRLAAGETG